MKPNFLKTKTDANQAEIVRELRARGVEVEIVGKPVDLLIFKKLYAFIEIKVSGSKACYTRPQLLFMARTRGPVAICKTAAAALLFAESPHSCGLTNAQKNNLLAFLKFNVKPRYQPDEIETVLSK